MTTVTMFLDAFPMTASGKIQKYKLRESFAHQQARQPLSA
jgi:acyl-coenzyme A synthetase/AMP-(fatty) acid ligase